MKKPYLNKDGRFILTTDTLVGNWLKVHIAWKKALREVENMQPVKNKSSYGYEKTLSK